jgi:hypothetical protein
MTDQARHLSLITLILATQEDHNLKPTIANSLQDLSGKYQTQKWIDAVAQVVGGLPSKPEVLSSNSSIAKNNDR